MVDSYGLRLRLPLEGLEDKADGVLVYFLSDTDHQLGKKKKLRLNIPPGMEAHVKYTLHVPVNSNSPSVFQPVLKSMRLKICHSIFNMNCSLCISQV